MKFNVLCQTLRAKKILALLASSWSFPSVFSSLPIEPWLGNVWEFEFRPAYTYRHFNKVEGAKSPLRHSSNDQFINLGLGVVPMFNLLSNPDWEVDTEIEFAHTPRQRWGFESGSLQLRKQWWDDIIGDPVSLTTGFLVRGVSHQGIHDISCPYHSYANFELNASVGREWSRLAFWRWRVFGFAGLGMANRGYPWGRAVISLQGNHLDRVQYQIFSEGYMGFGPKQTVDIDRFFGYANIKHRSIDVGLSLSYIFDIWGTLKCEYAYRVYARAYPAHANTLILSYNYPFSLF